MATIRERILARPDLDAMRASRDITGLAAALNAQPPQVVRSRMLTERGIVASYGLGADAGAAFLDKLDTIAASGAAGTAALKRMMKYLYGDEGIDIGDSATRDKLDAMVGSFGITQQEVDAIKAMAMAPLLVTQEQVAEELYNPDGSEK